MTMRSPGRRSSGNPGQLGKTTSSTIDRKAAGVVTPTRRRASVEGLAMKITNEVLEGYLNCKTKGHLKLAGESGTQSDYEAMTTAAGRASREAALARLVARFGEGDACRGVAVTAATLKQGAPLLADATLEDEGLSLRFDALKRADGASKLGDHHYLPVLHNHGDKVGRTRKLLLAVLGLVLARVQGLRPAVGLVARGPEGRLGKVRLDAKLYRQAEQVLDEVKRLQAGRRAAAADAQRPLPECEFRQRCHEQAVQEDNLSLLRGMGEKEVKGLTRKGIFTLTQLAHTFRPRRKGKRAEQKTAPPLPRLAGAGDPRQADLRLRDAHSCPTARSGSTSTWRACPTRASST